jgi:hypothetical protein
MPEGDWGLDFTPRPAWFAVEKGGEVVVVVYDSNINLGDPHVMKIAEIVNRRTMRGWESYKEITETEAGTLDAIGDVPTIRLHEFHKWEADTYPTENPPKAWWKKLLNIENEKK